MDRRYELHELLCQTAETRHVYFQPPENLRMEYPAIVYSRDVVSIQHADNNPYRQTVGYSLIVIDEDPDSEIVARLMGLPMCRWNRHYIADNLNHDVFTLYY